MQQGQIPRLILIPLAAVTSKKRYERNGNFLGYQRKFYAVISTGAGQLAQHTSFSVSLEQLVGTSSWKPPVTPFTTFCQTNSLAAGWREEVAPV